MKPGRLFTETSSLREAAAVIFALSAILPLLLFLTFVWRRELIAETETQVYIFLALLIALLGFVVSHHLMRPITSLAHAAREGMPGGLAGLGSGAAVVPGVGRVAEIGDIARAFERLLEELRTSAARLEESVSKLGALHQLAELAARIPALPDLLDVVLEQTMGTVRANIGSILLQEEERRIFRMAACRGLPEELIGEVEVGLGGEIAGKVAQLGDPVLVENVETDPRFARANDPKYGSGSFICLPIRVGDRVIGVLNLARKELPAIGGAAAFGSFGPADLLFLNTLMVYVGYAVDNARMLEETRQLALRLEKALDDLKAAQAGLVQGETLRALGELTSGMAHHLNNLLSIILGRIELLLLPAEAGEGGHGLESVRRAALDAAEVVRRVLRFARKGYLTDTVTVDLNEVTREVVELLSPRWQDQAQLRGIRIDVVLECGEIPPVAGEPAPLREVLINLLLNAIDALPEGGRITVRTWVSDEGVCCSVADSGTGMSDEVRTRVLEPFFTTKGPKSTGLGLSVSYGILQDHGGELAIDSTVGRGTTVTIRLPRAPGVPETRSGSERLSAHPPSLRILLIDDEVEVRRILADMLTADGHTVIEAAGGREGLARLEAGESADLVLTDLGMPDMTGWDVMRAVRARWPGLQVGLVTGWRAELVGTAEERGQADFTVAKPVTFEALRRAIGRIRPRSVE